MADKEKKDPKKVEDPKAPTEGEDLKKSPDAKSSDSKKQSPGKVKNKIDMNPEIDEDPGGAPISYNNQPGISEALTALQRVHRGQVMRRIAPKLKRAREIAATRIADDSHLKNRSMKAAREIIKKKLSGGVAYEDMDVATKQRIDKQLETKVEAIKRLAARLFPKVRQAEQSRHHEFTHKSMTDHDAKTMSEAYDHTDGAADPKHTTRYKQEIVVGSDGKRRVVNRAVKIKSLQDKVNEGLQRKADSSGFDREAIDEVYARGLNEYNSVEYPSLTAEQYAFGRVNKFIADQSIDEDLASRFKKNVNEQIKGWKNAVGDIAKHRSESQAFYTHKLNKGGTLSSMSDAKVYHSNMGKAEEHANRVKNLNAHMQGREAFAIFDNSSGKEVKRV